MRAKQCSRYQRKAQGKRVCPDSQKTYSLIRDTIRKQEELTSQNWLNHSDRTVRRQSTDACQGLE